MAQTKPQLTLLAALLSVLTLLLPQTAQANDSHQARVLYQKGNNAFKSGDTILARDYYRKSLALEESFDTLCNLGRAEAEDQLFRDAYEHLSFCVVLYPTDAELAEARARFVELKTDVRARLSSEDARAIDDAVVAEMKRREEAAKQPESGLGEEEPSAPPAEPEMQRVKWKLPVVLSLAGAGVASGVLGGVMMVRSGALMKDADELRAGLGDSGCAGDGADPGCADLESKVKKSDTSFNVGTAGLIGAGVLVVSAVAVQVLVPGKKEKKVAGRARPFATYLPETRSLHLGWTGTF
jgi:hypothetical protein